MDASPHAGNNLPAAKTRGLAEQIDLVSSALCFGAMLAASLAVAVIIMIGTVDTVGRAIWNSPMLGAVEMTESLLATVIFLAMPYAQRHSQHVVVDIIVQMFSERWQLIAYFVALVATFGSYGLLAYEAIDGAQQSVAALEVSAGYVPVPIWIAKIFAAIGLVVAAAETLRQVVFAFLWPQDALTHRGANSAEDVIFHEKSKEIAPGISLHEIGGHSAGMRVVRIYTKRGWVVLAADASHFYVNIRERNPFPALYNYPDTVKGWDTCLALADSPDHVVPGHDPLVLKRFRPVSSSLEGDAVRLDLDPVS
jgi:TRAP-type mannitol/chloroaromatic compound transport system permease small subunit